MKIGGSYFHRTRINHLLILLAISALSACSPQGQASPSTPVPPNVGTAFPATPATPVVTVTPTATSTITPTATITPPSSLTEIICNDGKNDPTPPCQFQPTVCFTAWEDIAKQIYKNTLLPVALRDYFRNDSLLARSPLQMRLVNSISCIYNDSDKFIVSPIELPDPQELEMYEDALEHGDGRRQLEIIKDYQWFEGKFSECNVAGLPQPCLLVGYTSSWEQLAQDVFHNTEYAYVTACNNLDSQGKLIDPRGRLLFVPDKHFPLCNSYIGKFGTPTPTPTPAPP